MIVAVRKAMAEAITATTTRRVLLILPGGVVVGDVAGRRLVNMVVFLKDRGRGDGSGLRSVHHEIGFPGRRSASPPEPTCHVALRCYTVRAEGRAWSGLGRGGGCWRPARHHRAPSDGQPPPGHHLVRRRIPQHRCGPHGSRPHHRRTEPGHTHPQHHRTRTLARRAFLTWRSATKHTIAFDFARGCPADHVTSGRSVRWRVHAAGRSYERGVGRAEAASAEVR